MLKILVVHGPRRHGIFHPVTYRLDCSTLIFLQVSFWWREVLSTVKIEEPRRKKKVVCTFAVARDSSRAWKSRSTR